MQAGATIRRRMASEGTATWKPEPGWRCAASVRTLRMRTGIRSRSSPLPVGSVSARRTEPHGAAAPKPPKPPKPPKSPKPSESAKPLEPRTAVPTCRSEVSAAVPVHPSEMRAATSVYPLRMRGAVTPPLPQGGGALPGTDGRPPLPQRIGVVVCGRRTAYADFLLGYARERHMAARVDFIYELSPEDLPALFRLARTFVYLPDAEIEASIVPVVEALRAGLPMVLSDTRLNREAAGDAAVYVDPEAVGEVAAALENVLWDETFRSEMRRREGRRAELFSEYAVARRLIDIYSSL